MLSVLVQQASVLILMCTHILSAAEERVEAGQFISALTVRLRGALRLHQFTQQIGTPQSLLLDLPHVSPLCDNNKAVRVTRNGAPCFVVLRSRGLLKSQVRRVKMCSLPLKNENQFRFIRAFHRLSLYSNSWQSIKV